MKDFDLEDEIILLLMLGWKEYLSNRKDVTEFELADMKKWLIDRGYDKYTK